MFPQESVSFVEAHAACRFVEIILHSSQGAIVQPYDNVSFRDNVGSQIN